MAGRESRESREGESKRGSEKENIMVVREFIESDILRKRHPGRCCFGNGQNHPKVKIGICRRV